MTGQATTWREEGTKGPQLLAGLITASVKKAGVKCVRNCYE